MSTPANVPGKITILAVDDHPLILEGLANVLQKHPDMEIVGEAANGFEAIEAYEKYRPDVTLIDLQMPGMNGVDYDYQDPGKMAKRSLHRADHLRRRRAGDACTQSRGPRLLTEKHAAQRDWSTR